MAGWEEELAVLLQQLGVEQEEPRSPLRSARAPIHSDVQQPNQHADALHWDDERAFADEEPGWLADLSAMRREVDTIVNQVVLLMQRGDLDSSLKEDVMVVLRALRRRIPHSQRHAPATSDEAYLESASAMLHFCRLVLQLSEAATNDR